MTGLCPICRVDRPLAADGYLIEHVPTGEPIDGPGERCPGSGATPGQTVLFLR